MAASDALIFSRSWQNVGTLRSNFSIFDLHYPSQTKIVYWMPPLSERFAALHAQAALSEGEAADEEQCVNFSDCDSLEEDLEEPSVSPDVVVEPARAVERDGTGSIMEDFYLTLTSVEENAFAPDAHISLPALMSSQTRT